MWASIWEKKRHKASAEATAFFTALRSANATMSRGEYWRRTRSMAHWALNSSTQAAARSDLRRAAFNCLLPDCMYEAPCYFLGSNARGSRSPHGRTANSTDLRDPPCEVNCSAINKLYSVSLT